MTEPLAADLRQWIEESRDREAIRALAAAYQRGCDGGWEGPSHGDPGGLADLFTPDGTYTIPQRERPAEGRDEIKAVFAELQQSLPQVMHYLTNDSITLEGDRAQGEFKGIAAVWAAGRRHLVFGVYTGTFVRVQGQWRFSRWRFDLVSPGRQ